MFFYLRWLEEMAKLKGLGKGLDALLSASNVSTSSIDNTNNIDSIFQEISIDKIKVGPYQPRRIFDEAALEDLAQSIRHNGVIQPIVVRKVKGFYELIAGERRFRASKIAGLKQIPALVRNLSDEEALAVALIENIQRKDLNIIEEALGYKRLIDEFSLTHEELARITGRSRSHISNILRLLNLVSEVQDLVLTAKLDMGHARALLSLPHELQINLALEAVAKKMTTGEIEKRVAFYLRNGDLSGDTEKIVALDPNITNLEERLASKLGMMVAIKHGRAGSGRVTLSYSSLNELDNLLKLL